MASLYIYKSKKAKLPSLYIYKLKKAKLQEKTLARWDMSIHHVPTLSCVNHPS